jgi:hypothetical protein
VRSVLVYVSRDGFNCAVISITDEKFLAALKRWAKTQTEYRLTFRESKLGPEHH